MGDHGQWIKLDECINDYIDESEQTNHKYFKLWHLAYRAMTELGLDFFYQVQAFKLPVNPNLTVTLPPGFISYTKVGILNSKGEVVPITYNNKLTTYAGQLPDRIEKTQDNSLWTYYNYNNLIFYNYWDGYTFTNMYGVPSGAPFIGTFKIDYENGIILLDEQFAWDYVIVEGLCSPKEGAVLYIPIQFKEAIISYLRWKDIISIPSSRRGAIGDKMQRRKEYFNDRRLAVARYKPIQLEEAYQWNLENQRTVVKA